jgi:hypothetical protein
MPASSDLISIKFDPPDALGIMERNLRDAPSWVPQLTAKALRRLGPRAQRKMSIRLSTRRYTGALDSSVQTEYSADGLELQIFPTAKRGRWDGGLILELGTRPIPNAPWAPIRAWAMFRGVPAFPVWHKIRTRGVDAHPFLEDTKKIVMAADVPPTLKWLLGQMLARVLKGMKIERGSVG